MSDLSRTPLLKYPSTLHLTGSRLQPGDEGRGSIALPTLQGQTVAYEEKVDGANCGFRFDGAGEPHAQSRGHYLDLHDRSNWRERHWNLFKEWLLTHQGALLQRFEDRYVVFGEWMGAAHTVFYDRLPHLFLEFDIYDLQVGCFLDTPARRALCRDLPIAAVPVLYRGPVRDQRHLTVLIGPSAFATSGTGEAGWEGSLRRACALVDDDFGRRLAKMDRSGQGEGIYVKAEAEGRVVARCKWVRPEDDQGVVRQAATKRARELLAARRSFVWDAVNLDWQRRVPLAGLCGDYGARVRMVYAEAPEAEMRARNKVRPARVPDAVLNRMLRRWDPPTLVECHELVVAV